jgi:glycosyltransferase involved in cell wall biosynthesis
VTPLRVLYVHMIGSFGGASRSLVEVLHAFPQESVTPMFVTQRGSATQFFSTVGQVEAVRGMSQFDHTRYSHYRGVRWLVLLRELAYLPFTIAGLIRARQRWRKVDIIHLNEFTGLVVLWWARLFFRAPTVVHVRSVAHNDMGSWRTRWVHRMLRQAQAVIAIDENVRASLPADLRVEIIHNAFSPSATAGIDCVVDRRLSTLRPESFKVGFVGNLLVVKGILELIEAARITRERGIDVEFIVVGDDTRPLKTLSARLVKVIGLAQDVRAEIEAALDRYQIRDRVHLVGFTANIASAYQRMHVLAFPSHYDAPGRPIFEAAFYGVPSIVAVREPYADTFMHSETGLAIAPRAPDQLAAAIERMAVNRAETRRMGDAARVLAERNFSARHNANRLLTVYQRVTKHAG